MNQDFSVGLTVRARGTRFIVLSCDVIPGDGAEPLRRLHLRCIDDAWRNQEIYVLPHLEPVEPDQIPELDLAHPGRLGRFHLLMDAVRLSLAPGDDRLVASSRSRIRFEPYQLVPALLALELPRPRVLILTDHDLFPGRIRLFSGWFLKLDSAFLCLPGPLLTLPARSDWR
jgi:hypothetical protein